MVAKWKTPLSPDAFSRMGVHDMKVHQAEVKEAHKHLLEEIIPEMAKKLDELKWDVIEDDYNNRNMQKVHGCLPGIADVLHKEGVNIRHIGLFSFSLLYRFICHSLFGF